MAKDVAGLVLTGVILAGGRARRMGGEDKGLIKLVGQPLIEHVLAALMPVLPHWIISANRNQTAYADYGWPVIGDDVEGYCGPLAGVAAAMHQVSSNTVLTVPCDAPLVTARLVHDLTACLEMAGAEIAVAHDGERLQPTFALYRTGLLTALRDYLATGGRKIDRFFATHQTVEVDFSEAPQMFANVNTSDDLQQVTTLLLQTA